MPEKTIEHDNFENELLLKNHAFDSSIVAKSIADTNGVIIEANASFLKLWGYRDKSEIIGKSFEKFLEESQNGPEILSIVDNSGFWEDEFIARKLQEELDLQEKGKLEQIQRKDFELAKAIFEKEGEIKDSHIKRSTIFFLISYGDEDHNVKVEINIREPIKNLRKKYSLKKYLGISMMVAGKEYLFAGKLSALTMRREVAPRDICDIHYFAKKNWGIDAEAVKEITGKTLKRQLVDCIDIVETVKDNQIMRGLGELVNEKEKTWIMNSLREDTVFMLRNYLSVME